MIKSFIGFTLSVCALSAQTPIEVRVASISAAPGGVAQLQIGLTEPKPIVSGFADVSLDGAFFGDVLGIALNSPSGLASGTASYKSGKLAVRFSDPAGQLGNSAVGYPFLTIAVAIKSTALPGTQMPVSISLDASTWLDPLGNPYAVSFVPGIITIDGITSIMNTQGGWCTPGTPFKIFGIGFDKNASVRIDGLEGKDKVDSSTQIEFTCTTAARIDGKRVKVTVAQAPSGGGKSGSGGGGGGGGAATPNYTTYYAYLRAIESIAGTDPLISTTKAIFDLATYLDAVLPNASAVGQYTGLAIQNPNLIDATVKLEAYDVFNIKQTETTIKVRAGEKLTRSLTELLPALTSTNGGYVRIRSDRGVQLVGLLADTAAGTVSPLRLLVNTLGPM